MRPNATPHPNPSRLRRRALRWLVPWLLLAMLTARAAEPLPLDPPPPGRQLPPVALGVPQPDSAARPLHGALVAAFEAGRHDEARRIAEAALAAARQQHGAKDRRTFEARLDAAAVALAAGRLRDAGQAYTALIDDLAAALGPRAEPFEPAWYGLGLTLLAAGDLGEAERAFAAALQAHRTENGLHAPAQIGYLDAMTQTAAARGRLDLADNFQLRRMEVVERLHALDSVERADAARVLADWYLRTKRPREALGAQTYRVDILLRAYGRDDPRVVPALIDEARAYAAVRDGNYGDSMSMQTRDGLIVQTVDQPLNLALRILRKHEQTMPAADQAGALLAIGDVHWTRGDRRRALDAYRKARALDAAFAARLSRPEVLAWPADWPSSASPAAAGLITFRFAVSDRGRVEDIEPEPLVPADDSAGSALRDDVAKRLRRLDFRPALDAAGKPVAAAMQYRHRYVPAS